MSGTEAANPSPGGRLRDRWLRSSPLEQRLPLLVVAALSALLWALCFQAETRLLLPWIALAPLVAASLHVGSRALPGRFLLLVGWLHGILFWWLTIPWIVPTLVRFGQLPVGLSVALLTLLAAYLGSYHGLFLLACRVLARRGVGWWSAPAVWVLCEWLRGTLMSGFPWNLAGYSVVDVPGVLAASQVLGVSGWSALVLLVNCALARAWVDGFRRRALLRCAVVASGVALVAAVSAALPAIGAGAVGEGSSPRFEPPVSIVQPNTAVVLDVDALEIQRGYRRLLELSECPGVGGLVLWPESAAWPFVFPRDPQLSADVARITDAGCALLLNSSRRDGERTYNTAVLALPGGATQSYDKMHLVPFGEYVPYGDILPFALQLARNAGAFSKGSDLTILEWGVLRLGVSICFEITFADEVAARSRAGANVLVTVTNDAWYGDSSAPWQHLRAARFRAAENRRWLLRAALTGISARIDPLGRLSESLELSESGTIEAAVEPRQQLTWFSRFPLWVEASCLAVLACAGFVGRRRASPGAPGQAAR